MKRKLRADLALMFCSLIWGVTFVIVKNALDHTSVFVFLAVRFTLAAILMAAFRPSVLATIDREDTPSRRPACNTPRHRIPGSLRDRAWCWCRCCSACSGGAG